MGKHKDKKYIPQQHVNPIVLGKRIEKLGEEIEHHKALLDAVNKANDLHVEQLSNFVRHDLKNAIQGLDGILFNTRHEKTIPEAIQGELDTALSMIRSTLENFTELIPSTKDEFTTLPKVLNAVELLSRSSLKASGINTRYEYDRNNKTKIYYPFQTLVQVLHNLVINAHHALYGITDKKLLVLGIVQEEWIIIKVYDNADKIDESIIPQIFKYGYSTTGGTGIGLFHAQQVVQELDGSIDVIDSDIEGYTKSFVIKLKIKDHE